MTLQEILAQADLSNDLTFADLVSKLGDGAKGIKLADLRTYGTSAAEEQRKLMEAEKAKAERIGKELSVLLDAVKQGIEDQKKLTPQKTDDDKTPAWRKNPLLEELAPVVDELEKMAKAANARAEASAKSLAQMSAFYAIERMRSEYNTAPESFRKANDFNKLVAEALGSGEVVSFGEGDSAIKMPTLSKRIHAGTEADRVAAAVAAAVEKNNAEWAQKSRMAQAGGKPASGTKFTTRKAGEPPVKNFAEMTSEKVMEAEAADPEFAKALAGEPIM